MKIINSIGNHFHQVSWRWDQNCGFFINDQFLKVCRFFSSDFTIKIIQNKIWDNRGLLMWHSYDDQFMKSESSKKHFLYSATFHRTYLETILYFFPVKSMLSIYFTSDLSFTGDFFWFRDKNALWYWFQSEISRLSNFHIWVWEVIFVPKSKNYH